jgi:hypothetical protein
MEKREKRGVSILRVSEIWTVFQNLDTIFRFNHMIISISEIVVWASNEYDTGGLNISSKMPDATSTNVTTERDASSGSLAHCAMLRVIASAT